MRNGQSMMKKTNLQVLPTPKGNSPVQVPIHEDLKNGNQLTIQNVAKQDLILQERSSPTLAKRVQSATKSDNLSVSSQQLNRLNGLPGHKMLSYMHSPLFGQHGESTRLVDIIQVSQNDSHDKHDFLNTLRPRILLLSLLNRCFLIWNTGIHRTPQF